jgi:hypothetical protein
MAFVTGSASIIHFPTHRKLLTADVDAEKPEHNHAGFMAKLRCLTALEGVQNSRSTPSISLPASGRTASVTS